jgi:hypothetical protein
MTGNGGFVDSRVLEMQVYSTDDGKDMNGGHLYVPWYPHTKPTQEAVPTNA